MALEKLGGYGGVVLNKKKHTNRNRRRTFVQRLFLYDKGKNDELF